MTIEKPKKKSKFKKFILILLLAGIVFCIFKFGPWVAEYLDWNATDKTCQFVVGENWTLTDTAEALEKENIIESKWTFIAKYKYGGYGSKSQYPGVKHIKEGDTLSVIMEKILTPEGDSRQTVTLTVPEGFSAEMIAVRCENLGLCTQDEFLTALGDEYEYEFINYIPDGEYKYKLQGFLFPETYEFYQDATAHEIIDRMLAFFNNAYSGNFDSYDDVFKTVTLASLVEREAKIQSERATISGVMHNRIAISMPLQIDASAVYAVSDGLYDIEVVTGEHMRVDSVYNTYRVQGLPAGPICSPGLSSIIAAANPEVHEYLYYHTDTTKNDGSHIFTKTLEEHEATMN